MIIDFHTHIFPDKIAPGVIESLASKSHTIPFTDGTKSALLQSMHDYDYTYSVTLPVITNPAQTEKINIQQVSSLSSSISEGIIPFGGMHPEYDCYKEQIKFLSQNGIRGIKIHPAYQGTQLSDLKFKRIISCASEYNLCVMVHAGLDIGLPEHNFATVQDVLEIVSDVQPTGLILAHMGGWNDWDLVESDLCGADVYFDTSFSIGPIATNEAQKDYYYNTITLSDDQFARIISKHHANRILFGTDCPWQGQDIYASRTISLLEKYFPDDSASYIQKIMYDNAANLLNL